MYILCVGRHLDVRVSLDLEKTGVPAGGMFFLELACAIHLGFPGGYRNRQGQWSLQLSNAENERVLAVRTTAPLSTVCVLEFAALERPHDF